METKQLVQKQANCWKWNLFFFSHYFSYFCKWLHCFYETSILEISASVSMRIRSTNFHQCSTQWLLLLKYTLHHIASGIPPRTHILQKQCIFISNNMVNKNIPVLNFALHTSGLSVLTQKIGRFNRRMKVANKAFSTTYSLWYHW